VKRDYVRQCCGFGAFLTPGSGIQIRVGKIIPDHFSECLEETVFWVENT
jgi:hypothetical protein